MNRRDFVKFGVLPILTPTTASLLAYNSDKNKSCIFIYLHGGITATEFISPIPESPVEFRSTTGFVKTTVPEILLGGHFELLASQAHNLNLVHSFKHRDNNHNSAQHAILTGHESFTVLDGAPQKEPSVGSIVSALEGANNSKGMPAYIKLHALTYDTAAWLGATHLGYTPSADLKLKVGPEQFARRVKIIDNIENSEGNKTRGQYLAKSYADLRNLAIQVVSGDIDKAFKWDLEDPKTIEKYNANRNMFGQSCLTARRLVENGARFVTVVNYGWDMHQDIQTGFNSKGPELDNGLYALISDIYERGLNKDCLIVIATEFGRTPKINASKGRDHWANVTPLVFAGGDYDKGRIIGSHDKTVTDVTSRAYNEYDLLATVFDHFEFDKRTQKVDNQGRPRYLLEKGDCIL